MERQIAGFLSYMQAEKDCTENTVAAYRNDLGQFFSFVQEHTLPNLPAVERWQDVDPAVIQEFIFYLKGREYASSTVARKVAAVKSFFHFLLRAGVVADNVTAGLDSPKVKKQPPRPIHPEEIDRLLAAPAESDEPKAYRDQALMELLYATGMRVTELVNLNMSDLNLTLNTVTCGVGSKRSRVVPIYGAAAQALSLYLAHGRPKLPMGLEETALFLNHRGKRLTRQGLWLIIKRYVRQADIASTVTPHTLRHSFATHLLNSGADMRELSARLGHANMSSTQKYRQLCDETADELTILAKPALPKDESEE